MALPQKLSLDMLQTQWSAQLNPLLAVPLTQGIQINDVVLLSGVPFVVNHLLNRKMQGWQIVDKDGYADIKRTQPFNSKTLTIEANANVTVSLWCY
jgi:hypothetical protein